MVQRHAEKMFTIPVFLILPHVSNWNALTRCRTDHSAQRTTRLVLWPGTSTYFTVELDL